MGHDRWSTPMSAPPPPPLAISPPGSPVGQRPDPRVTTGGLPALRGPSGPQAQVPVRAGYGLQTGSSPTSASPSRRPAAPPGSRRRAAPANYPDDPRYGHLLGLTAGWYGATGAVYLLWLVTLGSGRAGGGLAAGLPWLLVALALSLIIAGLLRWAIVGWRALTLSFAAAVIGAGVATIAHSLSL